MSWKDYIDEKLIGSGTIDKAAIFSATEYSPWAASAGFKIDHDQVQALAKAFIDPRSLSQGFYIGEHQYIAIIADNQRICGGIGKQGVIAMKTNKTIIIAHHPETAQRLQALDVTQSLADYLIKLGY
ncbi:hypothetical protein N7471_008432 [Penicillium samsonianum]|uniref:uncharacterized protein n=1 Tax=Penicillium samsonianum TaxID=1882272 RepID=UPI0025487C49|nr:uncharacterized protein N7471_008432 [Penicillium samsonianum]KAJ6133217.1 hypothetical protein N7471_008432 [Penicillium samsonianum]